MELNVLCKGVSIGKPKILFFENLFPPINLRFISFSFLVTIFPIFSSNGIFIWWPNIEYVNVSEFLIQFWHNDSSNPTIFSDEIIGTTIQIKQMQEWKDIEGHLIKFPATTNIYSRASPLSDQMITQRKRRQLFGGDEDDEDDELDETGLDYSDESDDVNINNIKHVHSKSKELDKSLDIDEKEINRNEVITEVRVNENVTGILIPNTHRIVVRVIVKDREGELNQDIRYIQWKTVRDFQEPLATVEIEFITVFIFVVDLQIEDTPGRTTKFRIGDIESRSITFVTSDPSIKCVNLCYTNDKTICRK